MKITLEEMRDLAKKGKLFRGERPTKSKAEDCSKNSKPDSSVNQKHDQDTTDDWPGNAS